MALLLNAGDTVSRSYSYTQPSPLHPSQPQGTGERTENLFDKDAENVDNGYITNGFLQSDGSITTSINYRASEYIKISQNQQYALRYGSNLNLPSVCFYDSAKNYISGVAYAGHWDVPFITPQNAEYLRLSFRAADPAIIMLNTGSTPLPYEPYGYKIPISSANTTTPVYLGEVESTRWIKKLVFDGTENWRQSANGAMYLSPFTDKSYKREVAITSMNSHFAVQINTTSGTNQVRDNSSCFFVALGSAEYYVGARSYATAADFKTYLAQQYANGTPVTVWYVLATPQTAVVNEPLRKIGDYADTVSGISIPVTAGGDTISVGTTVQPSEVTVNYKGWHPVADVHERDNGQWD